MKFIVDVSIPHEPFNTCVRDGSAGEKLGEALGTIAPEVAYFTDNDVGRGMMMVVDIDDYAQLPHITEPLMLAFNASVHYRIAISPEALEKADLERYAAA